ncbi:DUF6468 domain-containing protein [Azospirillum sp. TSO22-1]|uniref:DUF6468 domain-containing protein n=1 Tax=Azospirillum sp. TSO22-1 TaxID=716789 RepID=UPI000D60AEF0|nr:DUF6468 domain-containing protein [Azospirillum sp. TSO22-1]PWC35151.1 hypothetical protein TSO221_30245 [Azospirillum sp. TSO22-1]
MVSYLIDVVLAVMLVTTTVFLVVVNKRLQMLRSGQSEINGLIATFSQTIDETDASVKRLVAAATEISATLADQLDRAKEVKEDMALILGSCDRAGKRIEESIQHARSLVRRLEDGTSPRRPAQPAAPPSELRATAVIPEADTLPPAAAAPPADEPPANAGSVFQPLAPDSAKPDVEPGRQVAASAFYARLRTVAES